VKTYFVSLNSLCWDNNVAEALRYLQNDVFKVVDHFDPSESDEFRLLTSVLFDKTEPKDIQQQKIESRIQLFEELLDFFPVNCKEPVGNIVDMIQTSLFS
jgi:hypothetical protein